MCLADDVEGLDECRRCGVRFERRHGRIHRAFRRAPGRLIWQVVFQRRSNSSDGWSEGFSEARHQTRLAYLRRDPA